MITLSPQNYARFSRALSGFMLTMCTIFTVLILTTLVLVTGYLLVMGFSSISLQFFYDVPQGDPNNPGGMANALVGTLILIVMASLVGIPLGMLAGVYLAEYDSGSWLATPVRFVADVLSGVPSIVVGILGYELLVVPLGGKNAFAGAAALGFIMIPIVARTTEEMLRLVPNSYREASIALGATKAGTILRVILPAATGSVVTGIMLAIARVAGETAPLLFTAAGARFIPLFRTKPEFDVVPSDLLQPFPSLTQQVFEYAQSPYESYQKLAWAGVIILISIIFILNLSIRYLTRGKRAT